jgi:N-acetyl-1-D-myo-inositol-2-amino-2-deoxy-alpha-D-glucopyranoside deacetylase
LLLVHAHPDDETITTGATMAHYAAQGVQVTLLTCTLGEEGEILVPGLARLEATQADQLGGYRIGELGAAMQALGVADHRFLGGAGRFRDSGMIGSSANEHPRAFWRAASSAEVFAVALDEAVAVIREVRPQVVVTYDERGGYGHPDHVMTHRVTMAAIAAAARPGGAGEPWSVAKTYWTVTPTSELVASTAALAAEADPPFRVADADELSFGVPDECVTAVVEGCAGAKRAALAAHRTQVAVSGSWYALSNLIGRRVNGTEHYRLVAGVPGAATGDDGRERDLFAGVAA